MLWLQWQAHVHGTLEFVSSGALLSATIPWGGLRIGNSSEPPRGSLEPPWSSPKLPWKLLRSSRRLEETSYFYARTMFRPSCFLRTAPHLANKRLITLSKASARRGPKSSSIRAFCALGSERRTLGSQRRTLIWPRRAARSVYNF